jgi:hypothetical protein
MVNGNAVPQQPDPNRHGAPLTLPPSAALLGLVAPAAAAGSSTLTDSHVVPAPPSQHIRFPSPQHPSSAIQSNINFALPDTSSPPHVLVFAKLWSADPSAVQYRSE